MKMKNRKRVVLYKINDGNTMTVSILSNSSDDNRTLEIGIQAGNAFDSFLFEQNKN